MSSVWDSFDLREQFTIRILVITVYERAALQHDGQCDTIQRSLHDLLPADRTDRNDTRVCATANKCGDAEKQSTKKKTQKIRKIKRHKMGHTVVCAEGKFT
jgi:hypothetical protein